MLILSNFIHNIKMVRIFITILVLLSHICIEKGFVKGLKASSPKC